MADLRKYHYDIGSSEGPSLPGTKIASVAKANVLESLSDMFLDEVELASDSTIFFVPLSEGPLGPLFALNTISDHVDQIVPIYVDSLNNQSNCQMMFSGSRRDLGIEQSSRVTTLSGSYDGFSGEVLLNSARVSSGILEKTLKKESNSDHFCFNARIQANRFRYIQATLENFHQFNYINFAYAEDSNIYYEVEDETGFPGNILQGVSDNDVERAREVLMGLFNDWETPSPLRSVELIRAIILAEINSQKPGEEIDLLTLYKDIDKAHLTNVAGNLGARLPRGVKPSPSALSQIKKVRNNYTDRLLTTLLKSRVLKELWFDPLSGQKLHYPKILKGELWETSTPIVDTYVSLLRPFIREQQES